MLRPEDINEISKLAVVAAAILTDADFHKATKEYAERFKAQEASHVAILTRNTEQHKIKLAAMSAVLQEDEDRAKTLIQTSEEGQLQLQKDRDEFKKIVASREHALSIDENKLDADIASHA